MSKEESDFDSDNCYDMKDDKRIVINSVENVTIKDNKYLARIDTGATKNSICKSIVADLSLGPAVDTVEVKSSNGVSVRDVIVVDLELAGVSSQTIFNVSNRVHMRYPILIGRNFLKKGFLVDCSNEDRDN